MAHERYLLRLPAETRDQVKELAKRNLRSMNSEFVLAVGAWLEQAATTANEKTRQLADHQAAEARNR